MRPKYADYVPAPSLPYLEKLLKAYPIHIAITGPRSSKKGDFRWGTSVKPWITINESLNPYAFLLTLVHELAHYVVYVDVGTGVKPHGRAWKDAFKKLMAPLLTDRVFPAALLQPLQRHMQNPQATSQSDVALASVLYSYDRDFQEDQCIRNHELGTLFRYRERLFRLCEKRRVRYLCTEVESGRNYTFHPLTQIEPCDG